MSYLDIYWQDRIYGKYDFTVYPDNIFTINGNNSNIESIQLHIVRKYDKEPDYFFSYFGKGEGGPNFEIFDVPIDINRDSFVYPIFKIGSKQNRVESILNNKIVTEIPLKSEVFYEFRFLFNNISCDTAFSFDYYIEVNWAYLDRKNNIRKTITNKSKKYTYSFAPMLPFYEIYNRFNPDSAFYYLTDSMYNRGYNANYRIDEFEDDAIRDFLWYASPKIFDSNGIENVRQNLNIPFKNIRDENTWIKYDCLNPEIKKNNFIIFNDSILFIIDVRNNKNIGYSKRIFSDNYVTEIIFGNDGVKNKIFNNYGR